MTRDEAIAAMPRFAAALAEAGFPHARVHPMQKECGDWCVTAPYEDVPVAVTWTAWLVTGTCSGERLTCWPCWLDGVKGGCEHDPWTSERPRLERAR